MSRAALLRVKVLHTVIWAFFACCIVVLPVVAWQGRLKVASVLALVVLIEALVLVLNDWRCPLTAVAARHTADRRDNFDIYLPEWLARHNKTVFGVWYVAGVVVLLVRWVV